jgi:putative protease
MAGLKDLRKGTEVNRNRDMNWVRVLDKKSSERRIDVWAKLSDSEQGIALTLTDEDGHSATAHAPLKLADRQLAKDASTATTSLREHVSKMGSTLFATLDVQVEFSKPWFVPTSILNPLRREAVEALEAARSRALTRRPRAQAVAPPVAYPEDTLTYLANVYNQKAHDFYARHGVKIIAAAYEAQQELGEVSLMITKHCVRFSMSLCPKQAKGVTGVQGTVKAEPLQLINGREKLTLRFDCKPCEMHVIGKMKPSVVQQARKELAATMPNSVPVTFFKTRPGGKFGH